MIQSKRCLIYLDDSFKEEYERLLNKDLDDWIPRWLKKVVPILNLYVLNYSNTKKEYHIYRIRAMLENYINTGSFSLSENSIYLDKMYEFKRNFESIKPIKKEAEEILNYFLEFKGRE